MMIDGPEEWKMPESEQVQGKHRTSTGQVQDKYPQSPRHPRQKYLLTVKGMMLFNELNK